MSSLLLVQVVFTLALTLNALLLNVSICVFLALIILWTTVFKFVLTILKQSKLLKISVFLFPIILNGLNISITFILLLLPVLIRSCVLFLLQMFGPCLKLLLLMFAPNWNIILQFGIHMLKKTHSFWNLYIQKKFTCNVFLRCNIPFCSYADRLDKLGIKSLEYRRLQFDIILMFKIYRKLSDLHFDNYFNHSDRKYNFRSHNFKIKSKLCTNTEQFRNFFFIRIINV